jgi:N-sulfoglucosamine sulfohydrolase
MRSDALVSTVDVLPTILDALGLPEPGKLHGQSLRFIVQGGASPWRDYLLSEFHFHGRTSFYPRRAIRDHTICWRGRESR